MVAVPSRRHGAKDARGGLSGLLDHTTSLLVYSDRLDGRGTIATAWNYSCQGGGLGFMILPLGSIYDIIIECAWQVC